MLSTCSPDEEGLMKLMVVLGDIDSCIGPAAASISKELLGTTWLLICKLWLHVSGMLPFPPSRPCSLAMNYSIS